MTSLLLSFGDRCLRGSAFRLQLGGLLSSGGNDRCSVLHGSLSCHLLLFQRVYVRLSLRIWLPTDMQT